jgi:hypothetical protein
MRGYGIVCMQCVCVPVVAINVNVTAVISVISVVDVTGSVIVSSFELKDN